MLDFIVSDLRAYLQDALALLLCLAAFRWGAGPERIIAFVWFFFFKIVSRSYEFLIGSQFQLTEIDLFFAVNDLVAGLLLLFIALNANRNYPLWIAAMQLLAIAAHAARGITEAISPVAYAVMIIAPSWLQLFILAFGLARHVRREKAHGPYREWRIPTRLGGLIAAREVRG